MSDILRAVEEKRNVWIDEDTNQYNVGGGYAAIYGWIPIPQMWIDEVT